MNTVQIDSNHPDPRTRAGPITHIAPDGQPTCEVCGRRVDVVAQEDPKTRRTFWTAAAISLTGALVSLGVFTVLLLDGRDRSSPPPALAEAGALQQWWAAAQPASDALRDAVKDAQRSLIRLDRTALQNSCQRMHDSAAIDVPAHLPAPDPYVTVELRAVNDDVHAAAHMCLAVAAGAPTNYDGEFVSNLNQAERHLTEARREIDRLLHPASPQQVR